MQALHYGPALLGNWFKLDRLKRGIVKAAKCTASGENNKIYSNGWRKGSKINKFVSLPSTIAPCVFTFFCLLNKSDFVIALTSGRCYMHLWLWWTDQQHAVTSTDQPQGEKEWTLGWRQIYLSCTFCRRKLYKLNVERKVSAGVLLLYQDLSVN